jgi:hypothetical protein
MSFRICSSTVRSAIARRSRAFSFLRVVHLLGLLHLETAVFLPPTIEGLVGDSAFFAGPRLPWLTSTSICTCRLSALA